MMKPSGTIALGLTGALVGAGVAQGAQHPVTGDDLLPPIPTTITISNSTATSASVIQVERVTDLVTGEERTVLKRIPNLQGQPLYAAAGKKAVVA